MNPEIYFKILLLALGRDAVVTAFSLADFFANGGKQILINSAAQYGGYFAAKTVGNQIDPSILIPIVANSKLGADFLQASQAMPGHPERVATVAFVFSSAGLITKTTDILTNATMGALIAAFADYMASFVNNNGPIPFAFMSSRRRLIKRTFREQIKMEMLLLGLILASLGCFVIVVVFTKNFLKKSIKTIKNFRVKPWYNSNTTLVEWIKM